MFNLLSCGIIFNVLCVLMVSAKMYEATDSVVCAINSNIPTVCDGTNDWRSIEVAGMGRFCAKGTPCENDIDGECPGPQKGLPYGSRCQLLPSSGKKHGCLPRKTCQENEESARQSETMLEIQKSSHKLCGSPDESQHEAFFRTFTPTINKRNENLDTSNMGNLGNLSPTMQYVEQPITLSHPSTEKTPVKSEDKFISPDTTEAAALTFSPLLTTPIPSEKRPDKASPSKYNNTN